MAAFREHVLFSSLLGVGYSVALKGYGIEPAHAVLAGGVCGVSGMLPDLDSDSGKPIRELFGVTAAVVPLLLFQRLRDAGFTGEQTILAAAVIYLAIRFGAAWLFKHLTVHRGMFHSLPAALIVAELTLLAHDCPGQLGNLALAGGALLGFLSHLVLDDIYGLKHLGAALHGNRAPERGLKLFSRSAPASMAAWLLLGVLTYTVGVRQGYLRPVQLPVSLAPAQGAPSFSGGAPNRGLPNHR
jgi:LexA-binding, inner membrane-associated putative hydrolase